MDEGSFPFKYLGSLISPRRIQKNSFQPLVTKAHNCIKAWNHNPVSLAGRATLINSVLMPITTYQLLCVNVHESILDQTLKIATKFQLGKGEESYNHSGFHTMGWSTTTLAKTEGGLGNRNLRIAKIALMSKNVFSVLNQDDKLWIHIFNLKYGEFSCWNNKPVPKASSFYKALCSAAAKVKPNCWINECNPASLNFLNDPWLFEIPLGFKLTFLNMDIFVENFSVEDCLELAWTAESRLV